MPLLPALQLAAALNVCRHHVISAEVAARGVIGEHTAHHVVDPDGVLGLDPFGASELDTAIGAALLFHQSDWALVLPRPGSLGPLTGPPALTTLALTAGAAVLAVEGGLAWIPHLVGNAVQWQVIRANRPRLTLTPTDALRQMNHVVQRATDELSSLGMTSGERPYAEAPVLPAAYGARAQDSVARAWLLAQAAEAGLEDDSGILHLHAIQTRRGVLTELRQAAEDVLCAAVTWTGALDQRAS